MVVLEAQKARQRAREAARLAAQREWEARCDAVQREMRGAPDDLPTWEAGRNLRGVYVIRHRASGREYIGQSVNVRARLKGHFSGLARGLGLRGS